jgi:hypothetical protein
MGARDDAAEEGNGKKEAWFVLFILVSIYEKLIRKYKQ